MIGDIAFLLLVVIAGCTQQNTLEIEYIKGEKTYTENIQVDKLVNESGAIQTGFIQNIRFEKIDSAYLKDNNPDRVRFISIPVELDFSKPIKKYSPEYYTLATAYYFDKAINYYNNVFDNKLDMKSQEEYRNLQVLLGDYALLSHPNQFVLEEKQLFSPSIFYHEVGHIAFWTLEEELGVKFKGLSTLHVGLLEYFTVSLFDSPVVGELVLRQLERNAALLHSFPQPYSMKLRTTMKLIYNSFQDEIKDRDSFMGVYYKQSLKALAKALDHIDNHRGGMLYTSTLWRIREQLGQEKTDKLVAETILSLNEFMEQRSGFYTPNKDEKLEDKIMWYDLYYGLIEKDIELFNGANEAVINAEFSNSNFPVFKINKRKKNE